MSRDSNLIDRLMAKVKTQPDGCMVWEGATAGAGYGVISVDAKGKLGYVHRVVYEHFVGAISDGLEIDHLCRNRLCVSPFHLEAVTHEENRRRARQQFCKRGHPLSDGRVVKGHGRTCRKCDAIRSALYRRRSAS